MSWKLVSVRRKSGFEKEVQWAECLLTTFDHSVTENIQWPYQKEENPIQRHIWDVPIMPLLPPRLAPVVSVASLRCHIVSAVAAEPIKDVQLSNLTKISSRLFAPRHLL
jgi:hypothetical protein